MTWSKTRFFPIIFLLFIQILRMSFSRVWVDIALMHRRSPTGALQCPIKNNLSLFSATYVCIRLRERSFSWYMLGGHVKQTEFFWDRLGYI